MQYVDITSMFRGGQAGEETIRWARAIEADLTRQLLAEQHTTWHQPDNPAMQDAYETNVHILAWSISQLRAGVARALGETSPFVFDASGAQKERQVLAVRREFGK